MMRKRTSIKGIGASIFHESYDTGDLIALLDAKAQASIAATAWARPVASTGQGASLPPDRPAASASRTVVLERPAPGATAAPAAQAVPQPEAINPAPARATVAIAVVPQNGHSAVAGPARAGANGPAASIPRNGSGSNGVRLAVVPISSSLRPAASLPGSLPVGTAKDGAATVAASPPAKPAAPPAAPAGAPPDVRKAAVPEQESLTRQNLREQAIKDLFQEVNVLYDRVTRSVSARADIAQGCLDWLAEARHLLLLGDPGTFNLAERRVNQVKLAINRVEQTRRWSHSYGWGLFVYELVLLGLCVAALLLDRRLAESISAATGTGEPASSMAALFAPWNAMLWGAIGGIMGALYSLRWHVSELQDFNKQYSLWYVVEPFMGFVFGGLIYLAIMIGLLILVPGASYTDTAPWFPALLACLAGYRQKFAYEMLDNITNVLGRQPLPAAA